jgi:hypothetical protein
MFGWATNLENLSGGEWVVSVLFLRVLCCGWVMAVERFIYGDAVPRN